MSGALERVMVCSPRTAGWNQPERAARWQELGFQHAPDFARAQSQHEALCRELETAGAEVVEMPPAPDLSLDAVYAHDASLPTDYGLIVMRPGKPNRVAEGQHHSAFCLRLIIPMLAKIVAPGTTEAGDIIGLDPKTLLIGHGYRTNAEGIRQMWDLLAPKGIEVLSAPLPYGPGPSACLHLMSLISLLDEHTALVDLPWIAVETVELLRSRGGGSRRIRGVCRCHDDAGLRRYSISSVSDLGQSPAPQPPVFSRRCGTRLVFGRRFNILQFLHPMQEHVRGEQTKHQQRKNHDE